NGSAIAEKTTEYSVTMIGSTSVYNTAAPATIVTIITTWNRAASAGRRNLPHGQPRNWARMEPPDNVVSNAAPNVAATIPTIAKARNSFPPAATTGITVCDSEV